MAFIYEVNPREKRMITESNTSISYMQYEINNRIDVEDYESFI